LSFVSELFLCYKAQYYEHWITVLQNNIEFFIYIINKYSFRAIFFVKDLNKIEL